MDILKIIKDILIFTFLPFSCQYKEFLKFEIEIDDGKNWKFDKDQLPDILAYIDIIFYTYIYSVIFTWRGQMIPYYTYSILFIYVSTFYFSVFFFRFMVKKLKLLKYKNLS